MTPVRLVGVIGGANCSEPECKFAEEAGRLIAEAGFGIICGGRGGVMEAVCRGAWQQGGLTIGLLPSSDLTTANNYLTIALPTGLGEARNALVVLPAEVVLAVGGGYGTLSEIALALKRGIPVFGYQTWSGENSQSLLLDVHSVQSPEDAIRNIKMVMGTTDHKKRRDASKAHLL